MSAVDPNNPVIVIPGGGGGGSVTAASIASALADPGDAADVNAALAGRVIDALDGTGWTTATVGGSAVASWGTSPARLLLTNPGGTNSEARAVHPTFAPDGDSVDVLARFDLASTSVDGWVALRLGVNASNILSFDVKGSGALAAYLTEAGSTSSVGSASAGGSLAPSTAQLGGGQFWARISRRPGSVALSWGVGSAGALPTTWKTWLNLTSTSALNCTAGTRVHINTYTAASIGGGFDAEVLDIRAVGRGLGPL